MDGCDDELTNITDAVCWTEILPEETMSKIWESQYFDNDEIFMESQQNVTNSFVKYAPCRYCDAVSVDYNQRNLKLIQQTPADPASITINQPVFDNLNFNLNRLSDTCNLEKVDLPGNQFNKATQVIIYYIFQPRIKIYLYDILSYCFILGV